MKKLAILLIAVLSLGALSAYAAGHAQNGARSGQGQAEAAASSATGAVAAAPSAGTGAAAGTAAAAAAGNKPIGESAAKAIALKHAGLSESQVTALTVRVDEDDDDELFDDDPLVYDVEFYNGNKEYDYEIDAYTGEIRSYDYDIEDDGISKGTAATGNAGASSVNSAGGTAAASSEKLIGLDAAKAAALKRAGLSQSQVTFTEAELDTDDGVAEYHIGFVSGETSYELEINAKTGSVLEYSAESIYDND